MNDLDKLRDLCDRFINGDRHVTWFDIIAMIALLEDRDKYSLARAISFALRPSDNTNV